MSRLFLILFSVLGLLPGSSVVVEGFVRQPQNPAPPEEEADPIRPRAPGEPRLRASSAPNERLSTKPSYLATSVAYTTRDPSTRPSTVEPSQRPTSKPTTRPSSSPSVIGESEAPSQRPSTTFTSTTVDPPSQHPSTSPSKLPRNIKESETPSQLPSNAPIEAPTANPTNSQTTISTVGGGTNSTGFPTSTSSEPCSAEKGTVQQCYGLLSNDQRTSCDSCMAGRLPQSVDTCEELEAIMCDAIASCNDCQSCQVDLANFLTCAFSELVGCSVVCAFWSNRWLQWGNYLSFLLGSSRHVNWRYTGFVSFSLGKKKRFTDTIQRRENPSLTQQLG